MFDSLSGQNSELCRADSDWAAARNQLDFLLLRYCGDRHSEKSHLKKLKENRIDDYSE